MGSGNANDECVQSLLMQVCRSASNTIVSAPLLKVANFLTYLEAFELFYLVKYKLNGIMEDIQNVKG